MAKLGIVAVGRMKRGPEQELCEMYFTRARPLLPRLGLQGVQVRELPESRAARPELRQREEAAAILKGLRRDDVLLALDERGEMLDSPALARCLQQQARHARMVHIVIGGPDGLDEEVRRRARVLISFGRMTWPHRLVRVMLAEQLYRAASIAAGLPYHRGN